MPAPERRVRVWRLDITYPESGTPVLRCTCVPGMWHGEVAHSPSCDTNRHAFWPRERLFLSATSANRRAQWLQDHGCTVHVEPSHPVTWPW